ncbi:UbiD family decarboxylase [Chrysiogenes arsenatis]|uniref:UbiD family decarboxylase n=1 Tax=Chrysiogenes arsenatis TaxID=309797 RepID=UPI000409C172|nr:UbiD family decarboxylase [Chrysiogenes arsenatis]
MGYRNLQHCVADLERHGHLRRIDVEVDPHLEMGMMQRRVYAAGGPALFFTKVTGSRFPMLGNLFGTLPRTRFLFRDTLASIERLVDLKLNPMAWLKNPLAYARTLPAATHLLPRNVKNGPILGGQCHIHDLPRLVSWPKDGGAFVTLPQVYSESPLTPGWKKSNLGMYRVQLDGNDYERNREVGIHYQIHRGIGVHHQQAAARGKALPVSVFVGGAPSMSIAAVMPLPEGMPELAFAGVLGGHRIQMVKGASESLIMPAEADFVITGKIYPQDVKPEGPFGDHLGYYSLVHDFPVMKVEKVYHRRDAIWPFTSVGRPPQEDTSFGAFIHELTGALIPTVLPGVCAVHAVDAAGVHPLLLAVGSERYTPYNPLHEPQEILTQANAILGQGQLSLAKYLMIAAREDEHVPDIHDIGAFLEHMLCRVDWKRDLHFQTRTTIDTLDYSGSGLNKGSKVVIAAAGAPVRTLARAVPAEITLPDGFSEPHLCLPGVVAVQGPAWTNERSGRRQLRQLARELNAAQWQEVPLIVLVDDARFVARSLDNFLWAVFTRSDPAWDIDGVDAATAGKHWGCAGPLIIDARIKTHHAPPLEEDPDLVKKVEAKMKALRLVGS